MSESAELEPWQQRALDSMVKYKGRGALQITGRNTGKSQLSSQAFKRLWDDLHMRPVENLVLSEGTVYGARYYTVEPVGGSWMDMEMWAIQVYGDPGDKIWDSGPAPLPAKRWYMNNRKFWFREEKDRTMFILKWR
jgi:hypothetical protein